MQAEGYQASIAPGSSWYQFHVKKTIKKLHQMDLRTGDPQNSPKALTGMRTSNVRTPAEAGRGFNQNQCAQSLSCDQLFADPWTVACQAPLPMGIRSDEAGAA